MNSTVSNNTEEMHKEYLKAYYEHKGNIDYALHLPSFTKRINEGKTIKVGNWEYMSHNAFTKWLNGNSKN